MSSSHAHRFGNARPEVSKVLCVCALAFLFAACSSAGSSAGVGTAVPTQAAPSLIATTPAPTIRPAPTVKPAPTFTRDDIEIQSVIKDATAEVLNRLSVDLGSMSDSEFVDVFKGLRDYARNQKARIALFTPSACTQKAVDLFNQGMSGIQDVTQVYLDWVAGGATGAAPDLGAAGDAGGLLRSANTSIAAAC